MKKQSTEKLNVLADITQRVLLDFVVNPQAISR